MALRTKLRSLDWKFWISLLINLLFALYFTYAEFRADTIGIRVDITKKTRALDINEEVPGLTVFLNNTDIFQNNLDLQVLSIRIENNGWSDIVPDRFDKNHPFGIAVKPGKIVDASLVNSHPAYLREKVRYQVRNNTQVIFDGFYFAKSDYFVVKLFVLHDRTENPMVIPIGTIAGLNTIPIEISFVEREQRSFWDDLRSGSLVVHILRAFLYLGVLLGVSLGFIFVIVLPASYTWDKIQEWRRGKVIQRFLKITGTERPQYEFVLEEFRKWGPSTVALTMALVGNPTFLAKFKEFEQESRARGASEVYGRFPTAEGGPGQPFAIPGRQYRAFASEQIRQMRVNGIVGGDKEAEREAMTELREFLESLSDFLFKNGYLTVGDHRSARKNLGWAARGIRGRKTYATRKQMPTEETIQQVRNLLPAQPWPKGVDKTVRQELGISAKMYKRTISALLERGEIKYQRDGKLFDEPPGE